jgi:hypothetical protein
MTTERGCRPNARCFGQRSARQGAPFERPCNIIPLPIHLLLLGLNRRHGGK